MDTTYLLIAGVLVVLVIVIVAGMAVDRRRRAQELHQRFGSEYDRTVQTLGDERKAQAELADRQKHVEALNIRSLSAEERERYLAEWKAVQAKFVDDPGQAIVDADRLIVEVMVLRAYPVADFDQRAADISVNYPDLVTNYRAAREIALKNEQHLANTEDLRRAMIYYRSLFEELLESQNVRIEEKS